jgi:hypothetical protein
MNCFDARLIVLDEAHKYLTNADANQFTKRICSIIRQQRHMSARIVVSTQEPTVVPASVLSLLSWVICHRFSSPSWTGHLSQHICIKNAEGDRHADVPDWSERVMMLTTGQALLYSPASLFVSRNSNSAMLASGYAIIKTRGRLTLDGGASLLATNGRVEYSTTDPKRTGLMTPASIHSSPVVVPFTQVDVVRPGPSRRMAFPQTDEPDLVSRPSLATHHANSVPSNQVCSSHRALAYYLAVITRFFHRFQWPLFRTAYLPRELMAPTTLWTVRPRPMTLLLMCRETHSLSPPHTWYW